MPVISSVLFKWISLIAFSRGRKLAARGPQVALANFLCGPLHDLGISQCEKGKNVLLLRNIDINKANKGKNIF
jgi:hypothetical protein